MRKSLIRRNARSRIKARIMQKELAAATVKADYVHDYYHRKVKELDCEKKKIDRYKRDIEQIKRRFVNVDLKHSHVGGHQRVHIAMDTSIFYDQYICKSNDWREFAIREVIYLLDSNFSFVDVSNKKIEHLQQRLSMHEPQFLINHIMVI